MIFELRTYTLKVGALDTVNKLFAERLEHRVKYSPLAGYWYTDIGPLNQIIHIWPYKTLDERWALRNKTRESGDWPPSVAAKKAGLPDYHLVQQENKILMPAAFSPLQ